MWHTAEAFIRRVHSLNPGARAYFNKSSVPGIESAVCEELRGRNVCDPVVRGAVAAVAKGRSGPWVEME